MYQVCVGALSTCVFEGGIKWVDPNGYVTSRHEKVLGVWRQYFEVLQVQSGHIDLPFVEDSRIAFLRHKLRIQTKCVCVKLEMCNELIVPKIP